MKKISTLFIILVSCTLQFTAKAQLVFRESFSYNAGDLLEGQTGGTGFPAGSTWSNTGTATPGPTTNATIVAGSIDPTATAGNKVRVCTNGSGLTSFFDRSINLVLNGAVGTSSYFGFWYQGPGSLTTAQAAIPAQVILMSAPNTSTASDMRIGAGKSSNVGTGNVLTGFTRASGEGCASATSWPGALNNVTSATTGGTWGTTALALPSGNDKKYVLIKITKSEYSISAGTPASVQYFDAVRIWFLNSQPTSSADPIFTTRPQGDVLTTATSALAGGGGNFAQSAVTMPTPMPATVPNATNYLSDLPIQSRALRPSIALGTPAPEGSSQTCATVAGGVTGIRLRVEGAAGFCFDFDEIALGSTVESLVLSTTPVTFNEFTARPNGEVNELNWATSTEVESKGFHIEKSSDGVNWNVIGFEKSSGSNNGNYKYIDTKPFEVTYYRLQQEDNNSRSSLSRIVKVLNGKKATIKVYPSVAKNNITLQVPSALVNKQAVVYNNVGAIVATYAISNISKEINVSALASGMYVIKVQDNETSFTARFIKQ
jgi:hypothetical protein